jgi:hypothetical protein
MVRLKNLVTSSSFKLNRVNKMQFSALIFVLMYLRVEFLGELRLLGGRQLGPEAEEMLLAILPETGLERSKINAAHFSALCKQDPKIASINVLLGGEINLKNTNSSGVEYNRGADETVTKCGGQMHLPCVTSVARKWHKPFLIIFDPHGNFIC